jgi:hypothetical protein
MPASHAAVEHPPVKSTLLALGSIVTLSLVREPCSTLPESRHLGTRRDPNVLEARELDLQIVGTAPALFFYARVDHGLLNAVDGEGVGAVVEIAPGVGDVGAAGEAEGVQGQITESGQLTGSRTGPELGIVLAEGDVAGPVQTIFYPPSVLSRGGSGGAGRPARRSG